MKQKLAMIDVVLQIKQEGRKFWFVKRQGKDGVGAANVYWDRKARWGGSNEYPQSMF